MTKTPPRRFPPFSDWPDWTILVAFSLYALIVSLMIQLVLLPYVFPAWNAGDGLLVGLDSVTFNREAIRQAQLITSGGWQVWQLTPFGQPVVGIVSFFYALFVPHPWVILPLNAFLHGLAAWYLYKIMRFFPEKRNHAILAAMPLLFFPSSLSWVSQMHNDNYAVTGAILMLFGWISLTRKESWWRFRTVLEGVVSLLLGGGLIWLVRAYVVDMYLAVGAVVLIFLFLVFLTRRIQSSWNWKRTILAWVVVCSAFLTLALIQRIKVHTNGSVEFSTLLQESSGQAISNPSDQNPTSATNSNPGRKIWNSTKWLPSWIDDQMRKLSEKRSSAIRSWTAVDRSPVGSNIDTQVIFHSATDILLYLPRAVEIGLLSPFPEDWFGTGSKAPNTMMRRVSGLEMSFVYLCWPGLLYGLWTWRKRPELWVGVTFCLGMLLIYTLGTPNLGTLYRLRYPFLMPLVGLGVAGWVVLLRHYLPRFKLHSKPTPRGQNG